MEEPKIKTYSGVRINGEFVELKDLPPDARDFVGTNIAMTLMNTLNAGRAVFYPKDKEAYEKGKRTYEEFRDNYRPAGSE